MRGNPLQMPRNVVILYFVLVSARKGECGVKRIKRITCLLLAALMLCTLTPLPAGADDTVYFTAVNDQLLPLNDETMPFWSGGLLYVAHTDPIYSELGISCSLSIDNQLVVVYKRRKVIWCELTTNTIYDNDDIYTFYPGKAIVRGSLVFLPVETLCAAFGMSYSYNKVTNGYLVRLKNDSVTLSDATFLDAAGQAMATRYAQYVRSHAPSDPDPAQTDDPPAPSNDPGTVGDPVVPERTVNFAIEATESASCAAVLTMLTTSRVTFLVRPETARADGDLLRRLTASGHALALYVDGAEAALAEVEAGNAAIWAAANRKTRLVYAENASSETEQALREAGYCPLRFALRFGESLPTAARITSSVTAAADANGGRCRALLGTDFAIKNTFSTLLNNLRAEKCTMQRLTEISA